MTDEQKMRIIQMRSEGMTYSNIADELQISINTVKSFYRRNAERPSRICRQCRKPIIQPARTREKKFCCDKCRMEWWNTHKNEVQKKAVYTFQCAFCGKQFKAYGNNHRKYCDRECYRKARFGQ